MNTYTVPNPQNAEGLMNIGPAGKSFLVCRGIAGGILTDEAPVIVDRAAMLLWMDWATTDNLEAVMADNELYPEDTLESPENDDWDSSAPAADPFACVECGGAGRVLDGETCDGCNGTGAVPGADYWAKCFDASPITEAKSDYNEAAHQAMRDRANEPGMWPTASRPRY
jgi:hypothetical protein